MSAEEKQHDRMASRLAIIISRLLMGERLSVTGLSQEFRISERTLRRDFRERLSCLELTYQHGCWSLSQQHEGLRTNRDILHFARVTRTEQLFPAMDNRLISVLTDSSVEPPFIVWQSPPERKPGPFGSFWRITQAILERTLLDLTAEGLQYRWFAPYRLIYFENGWYLVGEHARKLQVFLLESITDVCLTPRQFLHRRQVSELTGDPHFIHSLPHFRFVRRVLAETDN
ncbi:MULTISPECIES: DeoR family transcriptional regulator [unclassified Enterobacter]|uniref:DeoR family transcriptional regulator n=1 Tax=unclassified Enterobacter TaxID=2608935 RepID=UPI0003ECFCBD|nr:MULTISPECIES: WYL domain-containing protein [unclassified Enterobacter]EWG73131.1 putative HTH-type transcriptional regulator YfjR [Enterobacter sp. DC4]EWG73788.1 putative HTH-type transcriptional regulator YfjR [Enterobacter sp. DC3]